MDIGGPVVTVKNNVSFEHKKMMLKLNKEDRMSLGISHKDLSLLKKAVKHQINKYFCYYDYGI